MVEESEYVVHWECKVYGTYGVYAESQEEAIEKMKESCIPTREADDRTGPIEVVSVEEY